MKTKNKLIKNRKGMTLVEVIVASSIVVLLSGMLSVLITKTFFVNRYTIEQGLNISAIESSLKNFSKYLREARQSDAGAYLIDSASEFELVFYADVDDDPAVEKVHYFLENNQLKIGTSDPIGFPITYPLEDESVKIIGNGITNTAEQPVFSYYNKDYPTDTENNPLTDPISPEQIGLIKIDVYANINPDHVPENTRMETFVRPRNIK
jgi:prepilin-type N-terminal cleavage/methylation domain-containing protein